MLLRFLFLFLILSNCSIAFAQTAPDLRGDSIDLRKTVLNLDFSNFSSQIMQGKAAITIRSKQANVNQIRLDLLHLTVDSVQANGTAIPYTYNDSTIHCTIPVLNVGDSALLNIFYHGHPYLQTGDFGGFYWDANYAFNIGVSFLSDPHNYGRIWFPCFDNFTERELFEYYIKTDSTRRAFCNGTLLNVSTNADSTKTWHWSLAEEIPSYLASVAVADYLAFTDTFQGINGTTPIELAVRSLDSTNLKASFMHLKNATRIFEGHFGAYPFERIGYCIVPFTAGAMEHAELSRKGR